MKKISFEEFHDRVNAIVRARKIFIPHLTKNIGIAFEIYQEVLAEKEREIFLTTMSGGRAPMTFLDAYERPKCPKCGEDLYLRLIKEPKGKRNQRGWNTCWECIGPNCFYEKYSRRTLKRWMKKLRRKK